MQPSMEAKEIMQFCAGQAFEKIARANGIKKIEPWEAREPPIVPPPKKTAIDAARWRSELRIWGPLGNETRYEFDCVYHDIEGGKAEITWSR